VQAFGSEYLAMEDHVSMDLKPVLESRMQSRHERTGIVESKKQLYSLSIDIH